MVTSNGRLMCCISDGTAGDSTARTDGIFECKRGERSLEHQAYGRGRMQNRECVERRGEARTALSESRKRFTPCGARRRSAQLLV